MKQIALTLAIAASLLVGCSKSETAVLNPDEMRFAVNYSDATRATETAFEVGDAMGVYVTRYDGETPLPLQVSGNYANNAKTTFDGSVWNSFPIIYWEDGKFDVYAYYPYTKPTSVDEYSFTVSLDQSVAEQADALSGYEASDFLWAKTPGVTRMAAVPLTFSHRMSKLVVNLIKGDEYSGEIPTDAVVRIHNTVPVATIDLASGMVVKNGYESARSITAKKLSDGTYAAIVVPQRLETKRPLVEVLSNGVSYLLESSFVFKAGTQHTINITLNNNPDQVKIEIGGEISNW